jgi:hypothetical protein
MDIGRHRKGRALPSNRTAIVSDFQDHLLFFAFFNSRLSEDENIRRWGGSLTSGSTYQVLDILARFPVLSLDCLGYDTFGWMGGNGHALGFYDVEERRSSGGSLV